MVLVWDEWILADSRLILVLDIEQNTPPPPHPLWLWMWRCLCFANRPARPTPQSVLCPLCSCRTCTGVNSLGLCSHRSHCGCLIWISLNIKQTPGLCSENVRSDSSLSVLLTVNQPVCLRCSGSDDSFLNKDSTQTDPCSLNSSVLLKFSANKNALFHWSQFMFANDLELRQ